MFIKPEELKASLERHGLHNQDIKGTRLGNPVQMLMGIRQYKSGKISGTEFGRRLGFKEGSNIAISYMGYALK